MPAGEATIARPQRVRVRAKTIGLVGLLAGLWGGFASWCVLVMRGEAVAEASRAGAWLGAVIGGYLLLTVMWIAFNAMLYLVRGPIQVAGVGEPSFEKDYFGRPLAVDEASDFRDQHLVLEFRDGKKVYRGPDGAEESEAAVAGELRSLAAAAGADRGPAPEQAPASRDAPRSHADERHLSNT